MNERRIVSHPILGQLKEQQLIEFTFNGESYTGYKGDTIASALLAKGIRTLRKHEQSGAPRGIYCNIGHCFECRVHVNGEANLRACLTTIKQGMNISSGEKLDDPLNPKNEFFPKTYSQYIESKDGEL